MRFVFYKLFLFLLVTGFPPVSGYCVVDAYGGGVCGDWSVVIGAVERGLSFGGFVSWW